MKKNTLLLLGLSFAVITAFANTSQPTTTIKMYSTQNGHEIGTVTVKDSAYGLLLIPNIQGLTPGIHGFHVHEHPSCADKGMAAGGHLDPQKTGKHLGPYDTHGHLGDLPPLLVDTNGKSTLPILAPRLKADELKGHALMIHQGGDNYSDTPEKLGGGGPRVACGVDQG